MNLRLLSTPGRSGRILAGNVRPLTLMLAALALAFTSAAGAAAADSAGPSVLVQLTRLRKGSVPDVLMAYGTVQASSSASERLMAPVSAVVGRIYVHAGQQVERNAPLVRLMPSPQTAASYAQAQTALRIATDMVARTRNLLRQHLASAQQLAAARKTEMDASATLQALKAQGGGAPNVLRAPGRAIVTVLSTRAGAIVKEGAPLLDLAFPNGLLLRVGVIPAQALAIHQGDSARIEPLGARQQLTGTVVLRGSIVDPTSGLVPIDITLPPGKVLPGESAQAAITTGQIDGYVVPHEAILVDDSGAPYVVQAVNMRAKTVKVQLLGMNDGKDVIRGPLVPSAPVVLAGNHQLQDGMRVRLSAPLTRVSP